ncbi:hypothetical protein ONZ43_g2339 [Nemania bipapillata]|uniref:Uncharacterized protein n=1 Tax=Nemania bipapillata TaxID=110536 RepID=A0ACC2J0Y6_9PEZI|nr:hypothetical protein ONZ43_g2339 [Nemania bipapillata]
MKSTSQIHLRHQQHREISCKPMAYLETSLIISKTLWYFDFKLALGRLGKVGGGNPGSTDSDRAQTSTSSMMLLPGSTMDLI